MLDIGVMELFVVAVAALVFVGPKELPSLLRTIGGFVRKARSLAHEFRTHIEGMTTELEREIDPYGDLKKAEGLRPDMTPEEITDHIMHNRRREAEASQGSQSPEVPGSEISGSEIPGSEIPGSETTAPKSRKDALQASDNSDMTLCDDRDNRSLDG